jgi:hypothetical protein
MFPRPLFDQVKIPALLHDIELRSVHLHVRFPVHGHDVQISVAHE